MIKRRRKTRNYILGHTTLFLWSGDQIRFLGLDYDTYNNTDRLEAKVQQLVIQMTQR